MLEINRAMLGDAITKWGVESQVILAIEECAELIVALSHGWRGRGLEKIHEEIADVEIMLAELRLIFGNSEIDNQLVEKLARLRKLLDAGDMPFDYQAEHLEQAQ